MYTCNETQGGVYLYPLPCQPRRRPSCAWRGVRLWRIAQVRQGSIFLLRTLYSDFHFDNLPLIVEILRTMHNLSNHHRGAFSFCHPDAGPGAEDAELRDRSAPRPSLSAYARNRPPLWKPVRQMPRDMQRWGVPPTTVSYCELRTLRRNSALSACERRAARTAWSLSGGGRRALARAAHQGCQAVWLVYSVLYECQRASSCALLATQARLGHEPLSVCEFAYYVSVSWVEGPRLAFHRLYSRRSRECMGRLRQHCLFSTSN